MVLNYNQIFVLQMEQSEPITGNKRHNWSDVFKIQLQRGRR